MTNPETLRNSETPETRQELNELKLDISKKSKDYKKFESLLKNSTLKIGLEKILKKESASIISTFESQYKERENNGLSIESRTRLIAKTDPGLLWFVCGDLGLPYEELAVHGMKNTKFSQLTYEQKMNFISLYNTLRTYNFNISKVKQKDFINKYKSLAAGNIKIITEKFNERVSDNENIVGLVDLKKVLKNQYGLTDTETKKVEEYVELVQKHPEYVGGFPEFSRIQQANGPFPWKSFFECVKWAIIVGGTIWGINQFKGCTSLQHERAETRVYGDHTEITNFKETFKVMSGVTTTDSFERNFKENGFDHVHTGLDILKPAEWLINKGVDLGNRTGIANRDLTLRIKCDNYHVFDFENMRCFVEKKDGIRVVRVTGVKKPEIITNVTNVEVLESHREIIHRKKFDDFDFKAQEVLKKEANETANSPEQIKKAEESLAKHILSVFQSTGCCNSDIAVEGKDIQGIVIEFEDNEHPRYVNIEGRGRYINN